MELTNSIELIQTFGVLPILIVVIWVLYKQVQKHEEKIDKLNDIILAETKNNAIEVRAIHENTLTALGELTETIKNLKDANS